MKQVEDKPMRVLVLVRHAETQPQPDVNSHDWQLTTDANAQITKLAERLRPFHIGTVLTSVEPKARQTGRVLAEALGVSYAEADGIQEHDRRNEHTFHAQDAWHSLIGKLFDQPDEKIYGNETANEALARFEKAIDRIVKDHPEQNIALITHNTVMSLFLGKIANTSGFKFWQKMGMPAFAVIKLPDMELSYLVEKI